jgi:hypothetical protein
MSHRPPATPIIAERQRDDGDLSDMLSELRILLPGAQMLTAFLILLPFNGAVRHTLQGERIVFLATFAFALSSLILLSAPAIQHRLMRPLYDRARFKRMASRQIVAGSVALACALALGSNLVISEVFGAPAGIAASAFMGIAIAALWWILPLHLKRRRGY